jgi:putative membrane protein
MNWHKLVIRILTAVFLFMLGGAIVSHSFWRQPPLRGSGSSVFLYIAGLLVLFSVEKQDRVRLLCAGLLGFLAEVIGVKSGWPFGRYVYTEVLAPNWLGAPLVMICAWFILLAYVQQLMIHFRLSALGKIGLGSLWMAGLDLLIDPLAAAPFNFWTWLESGSYYGIPLQNFLGWFLVSAVIFSVDNLLFRKTTQSISQIYMAGLGIISLYTIAAFIYGYYLAGIVGIGLSLSHLLIVGTGGQILPQKSAHQPQTH